MKNLFNLKLICGLSATFFIISFAACKKDSPTLGTSLKGTWTSKQFGTTDIMNRYQFEENNLLEFYTYKIDTVSNKILGYSTHMKGTYQLLGTDVTIVGQTFFNSPPNSYVALSELVKLEGGTTLENFTVSIKKQNNKDMLSLYFTCPGGLLCIPSPFVYNRE
jgi:hypothetical protein